MISHALFCAKVSTWTWTVPHIPDLFRTCEIHNSRVKIIKKEIQAFLNNILTLKTIIMTKSDVMFFGGSFFGFRISSMYMDRSFDATFWPKDRNL